MEPEYWSQVYHKLVFGHPMWIYVYRKVESEKHLDRYLNEQREKYCNDLGMLTAKKFICEPGARKELENFEKSHRKLIYSIKLSVVPITSLKQPVGALQKYQSR